MAGLLIRFVAEAVKEPFLYLKANLYDEDHLSRTILGKDYAWGCLTTSRGAKKLQAQPKILKGHGDDDLLCRQVGSFSYGPFYPTWDSDVSKKAKEVAWKHVLRRSGSDENETTRLYVEAVTRVENECRALYGVDDSSITNLSSDQFVWMMIIDGCFLLQVALLVLGGSKQLNYPQDDPLFSEPSVDQAILSIRIALSSMFMVGNQIPLVVLKELMKQSFFKNVVDKGRWEQPLDLERLVLFELLLVPMLDVRGGAVSLATASLRAYPLFYRYIGKPWSIFLRSGVMRFWYWLEEDDPAKKATDLLHGLWLLVNGVSDHSDVDDGVNNQEEDDDPRHTSYYIIYPSVRSATELAKAGVVIKHNEGTRINGIRFQVVISDAFLILPQIVIDTNKEWFRFLFHNLIRYEILQFRQSGRKVCEYILLLRELIQSSEDVKVLAANGVIFVDAHQEEQVLSIIEEFCTCIPCVRSHPSTTTIKRVRGELNSYIRPSLFKNLGDVLTFVVFLTVIQTVYSVLSYHLSK
ncbi:Protein of unknown function DUF247 [Macleaya cordata]|uniref:Uncharacterized protein n=1 Tax=Macleaya cordata TaxID=56857 RepID=A0A200QLM3_MACCD|nr:Protein of unknown function DUF247 [Macleaya cordata]